MVYQKATYQELSTTSLISDDEKAMVKYVFGRLVGKLGNAFASQLADKRVSKLMTTEWAVGLRGLNEHDLDKGLSAVSGSFAPSLPDFIASCKKDDAHNTAAYKMYKGLPKPKCDKATGLKFLQDMKRNL